MKRKARGDGGSASVEQTGLLLLLALAIGAIAVFVTASGGVPGDRSLANRLANRIACGPSVPATCRTHPVGNAYGSAIGKALRYYAPTPGPKVDGLGRGLLPVDFRYCRTPRCAIPDPGRSDFDLTLSNRRTTMFTEVARVPGGHRLTWWQYRPGMPWESTSRIASTTDVEAAADVRLSLEDSPRLVPLESLDGRNHVAFGLRERPPWLWRTRSSHDTRVP